jgi:hypothetical protein
MNTAIITFNQDGTITTELIEIDLTKMMINLGEPK